MEVKSFNVDKNICSDGYITADVSIEFQLNCDESEGLFKAIYGKKDIGEYLLSLKDKSKYSNSDCKVIINPPAVILFKDGKKYVAKAQDEPFDAERGLTIALLRSFGIGYSDLQKMLKKGKWVHKYDKSLIHPDTFEPLEPQSYANRKVKEMCDETMTKRPMEKNSEFIIANGTNQNDIPWLDKYCCDKIVRETLEQCAAERGIKLSNYLEQKPKPKRGRPRKVVKDETPKQKRPRGRPRKFKEGDIVAIKMLKTYKFANIESITKSRISNATYKVSMVNCIGNAVLIDGVGWFLTSEVELIEKAK